MTANNGHDIDELLGPGNQRRIARKAGISYNHAHQVLRGNNDVVLSKAAKMAEAAGVTIDELYRYWVEQRAKRQAELRAAVEKVKRRAAQ